MVMDSSVFACRRVSLDSHHGANRFYFSLFFR